MPSEAMPDGERATLYFHDCRFLSGYELRVAAAHVESLAANDEDGFRATFQLTNPDVNWNECAINRQRIGIRWRHVIDAPRSALRDELLLENYDTAPHAFPLTLTFAADFRDVFVIRGLSESSAGEIAGPTWDGDTLTFSRKGGDHRLRQLRVRFSETPARVRDNDVTFDVALEPHGARRVIVSLAMIEADEPQAHRVDAEAHGMSKLEHTVAIA